MSKKALPLQSKKPKIKEKPNYGKYLYSFFLMSVFAVLFSTQAFAAPSSTDIWGRAKEIMQDVYLNILGVSTIAAVVTSAIALLLMNFSKNGKTVDESRAWLKRIIITWVILNSLGLIMAYIVPMFSGGAYSGS